MQTREQRNSGTDPLGRYYSSNMVGCTLVREMNLKSPSIIMDLGAGDGVLSIEAAKLWKTARFITVDIDSSIKKKGSIVNNLYMLENAKCGKLKKFFDYNLLRLFA